MSEEKHSQIPGSDLPGTDEAAGDEVGNGEISEKTMMDIKGEDDHSKESDDRHEADLPKKTLEDAAGCSLKHQQETDYQQRTDSREKIVRMDTAGSDSFDDCMRKDIENLDAESDSQSTSAQTTKGHQGNRDEDSQSFRFIRREVLDLVASDSSSSFDKTSSSSDPKTSLDGSDDRQTKTKWRMIRMDTASSDSLDDSMRKDLESLDVESDSQFSVNESTHDPTVANQRASGSNSKHQPVAESQSPIDHLHEPDSLRHQDLNTMEAKHQNQSFVQLPVPDSDIEACKESCSASPMVEESNGVILQDRPYLPSPELNSNEALLNDESNLKRSSSEPLIGKDLSLEFSSETPSEVCELSCNGKTDDPGERSEMNSPLIDQIMLVLHPSDTDEQAEESEVFESISANNATYEEQTKRDSGSELKDSTRKRKSSGSSDLRPLKKIPAVDECTMSDIETLEETSERDSSEQAKHNEKLLDINSRKRKQVLPSSSTSSHPKTLKIELMESENQRPVALEMAESKASSVDSESEMDSNSTSNVTKSFDKAKKSEKTEMDAKCEKLSSAEGPEALEFTKSLSEKTSPKNKSSVSQFPQPEEIFPLDVPMDQPSDDEQKDNSPDNN